MVIALASLRSRTMSTDDSDDSHVLSMPILSSSASVATCAHARAHDRSCHARDGAAKSLNNDGEPAPVAGEQSAKRDQQCQQAEQEQHDQAKHGCAALAVP